MTSPKIELVPFVPDETNQTTIEHEWQPPALGSWWWVKNTFYKYADDDQYHRVEDAEGNWIRETTLACVMGLGSNYAKVEVPHRSSCRIHFDEWDELCEPEPNWREYIHRKIEQRKENVRELLREVQRVTAQLGIVPRDALAAQSVQEQASQALATASGTADINAHKQALVKAKEKTLPELFKRVEKEHEQLAVWMKAELMPSLAEVGKMKESIGLINDRIFTVELYAGLVEEIEQIADGKPAPNDTPISLFQRRHYMDEECLINYKAGGMHFGHIRDFDKWLCKPENRRRILPEERCIVAFRVRRTNRQYDWDETGASIHDFISFLFESDADKETFLYIRNGQQIFRLRTKIEFGAELFPDVDQDILFNQEAAWIFKPGHSCEPRSHRDYEAAWDSYREARSARACALWAWKRAGKPKGSWQYDDRYYDELERFDPYHVQRVRSGHYGRSEHGKPGACRITPPTENYERLTTDSVYYDDAMAQIEAAAKEHNRIAVVLQGLLDRSPVFQPHPPWRLWTPEGFKLAIVLRYDKTRAIAPGEAPDFEAYRAQLNKSIKVGSVTVGQEMAWMRAEAVKYNQSARRYNRRRHHDDRERKWHKPHGNPGPGLLAKVKAISRKGSLLYTWIRSRKSENSWRSGAYPTEFKCKPEVVLNASAYTPGDYKIFFDDPRTRADYMKWAPYLLAAEDFQAGKVKLTGGANADQIELDHDKSEAAAERARKRAEREAKREHEEETRRLMAESEDEDDEDEDDESEDEDADLE